ncbi:YebO family protein [Klebsiella michiganensis]|uniref:YebO family protein n=1 Tax=Klebsiella michiganensis TaxID=1134687 RepID=UPI0025A2D486|nr:YebO family protein [Klebsiella michiganensis]MDM6998646.1 YebO family protein [Klebsiella michiganensis]
MEPLFVVFGVFGWLINIIIVFYLIRFSVRDNDQVEALQEINKKQDAQIDLLIQIAHQNKNT